MRTSELVASLGVTDTSIRRDLAALEILAQIGVLFLLSVIGAVAFSRTRPAENSHGRTGHGMDNRRRFAYTVMQTANWAFNCL